MELVTLEDWMKQHEPPLKDEDVAWLTKAVDPTGKGVSTRTVAHAKARAVSHLRVVMLLCAVTGGVVHPYTFSRTMFFEDLCDRAPNGFSPFAEAAG